MTDWDEDGDDPLADFRRAGISLDAIDLDNQCTLPPDLLPELRSALLNIRRPYCRPEWWHTTEMEEFHDHPEFVSAGHRTRWFMERSGEAYLATTGADRDAEVFEFGAEMVSLNQLLAIVRDDPSYWTGMSNR